MPVRRVLEEKLRRELDAWEVESDVLPRVHARSEAASGYERKVELAIKEASIRRCTSVAIVVNRDRTDGADRLAALRAGRERAARDEPLAERTALGVAIETVEAWLLADEEALNDALAPDPPAQALPHPEGLDGRPGTDRHPKQVLRALVRRAGGERPSYAGGSSSDLGMAPISRNIDCGSGRSPRWPETMSSVKKP